MFTSSSQYRQLGMATLLLTPLAIFAWTGAYRRVTPWLLLIAVYFLFNPALLVPPGVVATWNAKTGVKLLLLLATALTYSFMVTCYAWYVGKESGVFDGPDDWMFYIIALTFHPMAMLAMIGIVTRIFIERDDALGEIFFTGVAALLIWGIKHFYPAWIFSEAISNFAEKASLLATGFGLLSVAAYFVFNRSPHGSP